VINRTKVPIYLAEVGLPGIKKESEIVNIEYLIHCIRSGEYTLQLNSRVYKIVASTQFTKDFMGSNFNLELLDEKGQVTFEPFSFTLPPYNGFGDVIDSEQNCKKLIAKPPKKDFFRYLDNTSN